MSTDELATRACRHPKGKRWCKVGCDPCRARVSLFGANIPVQLQEPRRSAGGPLTTPLPDEEARS